MKQTPPLLQLIEGRRVRPRMAPRVRPREMALHLAVVDILRRHCLPSWRWTHFPSGEVRSVRAGAKLKRMGLQRGWADFVLVAPKGGRFHGLELKRPDVELSEDQQAFQTWAIANDVRYSVAWSVRDALTILSDWGCLRTAKLAQVGPVSSQLATKVQAAPSNGGRP